MTYGKHEAYIFYVIPYVHLSPFIGWIRFEERAWFPAQEIQFTDTGLAHH